jgi:hypothetical protein
LQVCLHSRCAVSNFCGESISTKIYATPSLLSLPIARDSNGLCEVRPKLLNSNSQKKLTLIAALLLATVTLFVRTVFRSVELSQGFGGKLANSEVQFMILDGCMVIIACTCLTFMHPGYAFQKRWNDAKFLFFYNHFQPSAREPKPPGPVQ